MTPTEINKRLAELLGICWHEPLFPNSHICEHCGLVFEEDMAGYNPDFCRDPRLVLREMMRRSDWDLVINERDICFGNIIGGWVKIGKKYSHWVHTNYILDETGLLAMKAITFLEAK